MFCRRSQDLGNGTGSAVEIEDLSSVCLTDVFAGRLIEHLRTERVGLEKGEWSDLKF